MPVNVAALVRELDGMTVGRLREKYREVFGEDSRSGNAAFLRRRIAWQVQAREEGGLSDRARRLAAELADPAYLRTAAPKKSPTTTPPGGPPEPAASSLRRVDPRLPRPGTVLVREFRGRRLEVQVLDRGFEWEGQRFPTLTAAANAITGAHWNGFEFFGLRRKGGSE